jgi:hypothetical protein
MKRPAPIANETEFQEWLASVLQAERERVAQQRSIGDLKETDSLQQQMRGVKDKGEKA